MSHNGVRWWSIGRKGSTEKIDNGETVHENGDESGLRVESIPPVCSACGAATAGRSSTILVAAIVNRNGHEDGGEGGAVTLEHLIVFLTATLARIPLNEPLQSISAWFVTRKEVGQVYPSKGGDEVCVEVWMPSRGHYCYITHAK